MITVESSKGSHYVETVSTSGSIDEFVASASILTTRKANLAIDDEITLLADGDLFFTGFIDKISGTHGTDKSKITYSARSKTQDILDSTISKGFSIQSDISLADAVQIIIGLVYSSLKIVDNSGSKGFTKEEKLTGKAGDNAFELISSFCRRQKCLVSTNEKGDIVLTNGDAKDSGHTIIKGEGGNIKESDFTHDVSQRYNEYKVISQLDVSMIKLAGAAEPEKIVAQDGIVIDDQVRNTRTLTMIAEKTSTSEQCEERAKWASNMRKAMSINYSATVSGHSKDGKSWKVKELITVDDYFWFSAPIKMLIKKITLSHGKGGTTRIECVPENVYKLLANEPVKIEKEKGLMLSLGQQ